jgi:hypothetical protein
VRRKRAVVRVETEAGEVVKALQMSGYMVGVRTAMGEWPWLAVVVGIGQGAGMLCEAVHYAQSGK